MSADNAAKRCLTPEFRLSFPALFKPYRFNEEQEAKFMATMLFDKKTDISGLKKAAAAAATEKFGPKEKWPKTLRMPFTDGETKSDLDGYENCIIVKATSKQRPGVVDQKRVPVAEDDGVVYAGCYARATLVAFAYDTMGNKGVSFGLQNLQKIRDGEPFGSRRKAEDDFTDLEDTSENKASYDSALDFA